MTNISCDTTNQFFINSPSTGAQTNLYFSKANRKMKMNIKTSFFIFPLLLFIAAIAINGCQRPRPIAEPPPEPGLFSGKTGEFVFGDTRKKRRKRR
jgi:hypothetical protein